MVKGLNEPQIKMPRYKANQTMTEPINEKIGAMIIAANNPAKPKTGCEFMWTVSQPNNARMPKKINSGMKTEQIPAATRIKSDPALIRLTQIFGASSTVLSSG